MIRPNCKLQFTPDDFQYICNILGESEDSSTHLIKLFSDSESFDIILGDPRLLRAILESPDCLNISPHLYFYVLVRNVFKNNGIEDLNLTDYIAELLTEYAHSDSKKRPITADGKPVEYFSDAMAAMANSDDKMKFFIQLFIGNYSLFLSGIFPGHLEHRSQFKAAPDIEYYEKLGRTHFRTASNHRLASKYDLTEILQSLSESFHEVRLALNGLSERLVFLNSPSFII